MFSNQFPMKKHIPFLLIILLFSLGLKAQSIERYVISSTGGTYYDNINNFEMDYTVGEVAVTTISNVNNTLTQGFQQPFKLAWVAVQEYTDNSSSVILYPNPVIDHLNISIENAESGNYRVVIYDVLGQLLTDKNISMGPDGNATLDLNFDRYATGNYFVRILHEQKVIQTGKIIKVNQ